MDQKEIEELKKKTDEIEKRYIELKEKIQLWIFKVKEVLPPEEYEVFKKDMERQGIGTNK